ncbi:MAG: L-threonine 3-dehydrogenase [Bryobacteraceae bacterium]
MKALVKQHAEPGLWLTDIPEPEYGPDEVLIRVMRTGICGTDVHIYQWDDWAKKTIPVPMAIGHEFVGRVEKVGANVRDFVPGDIVSGEGHVVCGHCRNCLAGRLVMCANTKGLGVNRPGCFAEFVVLPRTNCWKHHQDIDLDVAAIFDPFGNAVHTALSFPVLGEDVLITGAGPIGIMSALVAKHAGARHVVITDINPHRIGLAKRCGVPTAVDGKTTDFEQLYKKLGMTEGFDIGFEMSGNAVAFKQMVSLMSHGGRIAMLGIPPQEMTMDWKPVIFNMLTVKGIYGREIYETWYKMTVLLESGLNIAPVITHRFSHRDWEKGFEVMKTGNSGKVVLDWTD